MNRRRFCATALLAVAGLAGCPSGGRTPETTPGETLTGTRPDADAPTPTRTSTDEPTPTATDSPTPTRTIPPYSRDLHWLEIANEREEAVAVEVTVRARDSDESRTFAVELAAGADRDYRDLAILDGPVTITARVGGQTYTYTPTTEGIVAVTVTAEGVEFEEVVT